MAHFRFYILAALLMVLPGSAPLLAQETTQQSPQQSGAQAPSAPGTGGVTGNLGPPEPRFHVILKSFQVFDETGLDFLGSDEAVFIVRTNTYNVETSEYGSLDSDDTVHQFKQDETCAVPAADTGLPDGKWTCDPKGTAAPVTFFLEAWEQDDWFGFCARNQVGTDVFPPEWDLCGDDLAEHTLIGQERVSFDLQTLLSKLPQVGQSFDHNVFLQGGCFRVKCETDDISPRYNVNFTVTRVADSPGSGGVLVDP